MDNNQNNKNNQNITDGVAISSRIRLARNIANMPFPSKLTDPKSSELIVKQVYSAIGKVDDFKVYRVSGMSINELEALKEKHLISKELCKKQNGAAIMNGDESISIMVNEEDHIREQCIQKGCNLITGYNKIDKIDELISEKLSIAFDGELGYLTSCPTNLGTGMRASVMVFLPALTINGMISSFVNAISKVGLTVRGVYGEGSAALGYMYQISNQVSLGMSEKDIIKNVEGAVYKICDAEKNARHSMFEKNNLEIVDRVKRAFGVLTNCAKLSTQEFMGLIADIKLGAYLGIIPIKNVDLIEEIITKSQPANIMISSNQNLTPMQRDIYRASYVGKALTALLAK